MVRRQQLEQRRPFFVIAAACFVLGLLAWGAFYMRAASVKERATAKLEEKVDAMRRVDAQMSVVRKQTAALDSLAAPLLTGINDRNFWPEIIEELNLRLPKEDIWITELVATSGGKPLSLGEAKAGRVEPNLTPSPSIAPAAAARNPAAPAEPALDGIFVRGLYLFNPKQQEVVVDYFRNLVTSPYFAIDPNNQSKVIKPTTPNNTEWAFPYELRLDLRKPIKLP